MEKAVVELFHHGSCSRYCGSPHRYSLQDWKCCLLMPTDESLQMFLGKECCLPKFLLPMQGWSSSMTVSCKGTKHPPSPTHQMQLRILLKSYSSFRSICGTGWELCCSYISGQVFPPPCPASFSHWKGLFSKAFPNIPKSQFSIDSDYW